MRRGDEITIYNEDTTNDVEVPRPEDPQPLKSREVVQVSVRAKGHFAPTHHFTATLETTLHKRKDWSASVIAPILLLPPMHPPKSPFYTGSTFSLDVGSGRNRIYATALGVYEAKISRNNIGDR